MSKNLRVDETWTLFLDRDGVINKNIEGGYVLSWEEFEFLPDVHRALRYFNMMLGRIVVVTNQQCIGKELLTKDRLHEIHNNMLEAVKSEGGRIDRVYYCPDLEEENSPCRKPETGMALWAKRDFPEIDFNKAIMVGDKLSDMRFGLSLGMECFFITEKEIPAETGLTRISDLSELLLHLSL
ncbi:MAG: HAD-IIIA family hydrolase [Bacteroidetes bacterium]|nr:HAD-IIIA family hydrolase [Bacteroidota bacterium]